MKKSQKSYLHIAVYFVFPRNRNQDDLPDTNFNLASSCNSKLQSVRKFSFFLVFILFWHFSMITQVASCFYFKIDIMSFFNLIRYILQSQTPNTAPV